MGMGGIVGADIAKAGFQEVETPMIIYSDTLEVQEKSKVITFEGHVNAKKEDLVIDSQKMRVFYESSPGQSKDGSVKTRIKKIVSEGAVKIKSLEGGTATADQAVYYHTTEKIVLIGNAIARQEDDFVEGEKITIFLKENKRIVEGSKDKRVRAVIFPGQGKR
jgi:lipopolysaccharide export system protein LptA